MTDPVTALGLMSGTSMDGVDVALVESDGEKIARRGPGLLRPYRVDERDLIVRAVEAARNLTDRDARPELLAIAEEVVTLAHGEAIGEYLSTHGLAPGDIDVAGFHGQTLAHRPDKGLTLQIGNGSKLAALTGIDVVYDLRGNDMLNDGQGAPLVAVYHRALVREAGLELPVAVVNIGGVANVTWIGRDEGMLAFDTGPGNAMLDDWVAARTDQRIDDEGILARKGRINSTALEQLLSSTYFDVKPPKSLDRNDFSIKPLEQLGTHDGAATLTAFSVEALARAVHHMPSEPLLWVICGGGARNPAMMEALRDRLAAPVRPADDFGWSGAFMEAEAFAFLAIRSQKGLPLTYPETTGVREPVTGGVCAEA